MVYKELLKTIGFSVVILVLCIMWSIILWVKYGWVSIPAVLVLIIIALEIVGWILQKVQDFFEK